MFRFEWPTVKTVGFGDSRGDMEMQRRRLEGVPYSGKPGSSMNVSTVSRHIGEHLRNEGVAGTIRWLLKRAQWRWNGRRYGIRTEAIIPMSELGINDEESGEYHPTDYTDFAKMIRELALEPSDHVFVDYGAGMGRVMILAATQPFERVLGIEHSAELVSIAKRNIEKARPKLSCRDVEIIEGDAALYPLPPDASVIFFNNPFFGEVLEHVLANIRAVAEQVSRPLLLVCNLPSSSPFETQILRHGWLSLRRELALNDRRKCLIFETRLRSPRPAS